MNPCFMMFHVPPETVRDIVRHNDFPGSVKLSALSP